MRFMMLLLLGSAAAMASSCAPLGPIPEEGPVANVSQEVADRPGIAVEQGEAKGASFFALQRNDELTIGRSGSSDVIVAEGGVSRRHARLIDEEGEAYIEDFSINGTFVNGQSITKVALRSGDRIRIGRTVFRFTAP